MTGRYILFLLVLGLGVFSIAAIVGAVRGKSASVCTSSFVYRLDDGESEKGGWESKDGLIIVQADPRVELHGPFGMLVCTNGNTRIEFFKP